VQNAFIIPTGRYAPGGSNNVGSGYFGNHLQTDTTFYITKNKDTSANLFTDWEVHGPRQGTNNTFKTPGQAFTDEGGLGQVLPLKKDFTKLLQVGVVGYDQWQVTNNGGTISLAGVILPASIIPSYSVHAIGGQLTYILPVKNFSLFFKGYHEYSASAHTLGNTIVFGGAWTLPIHLRQSHKIQSRTVADTLKRLLRSLWRAIRVVGRLHLPQFEHAVEHGDCHSNNEEPGRHPFNVVRTLSVGDIACDNQTQDAEVDDPVDGLRHDEMQGSEAGELIKHER
jgi:Putative MetA-pathway of phenol degradation